MRLARNRLGLPAALFFMIGALACGSSTSDTGASSTGAEPGTTGGTTGGVNGSTGSSTGSAAGATASAAAASSTGAAAGSSTGAKTSAGTSGTTGGGSSTGSAAGTTGGIAHGPGNSGYCDGIAVEQGGVTDFLIYYPESDPVRINCDPAKYAADSGPYAQLGGIWAFYTTTAAQGIFPGGCDDLGIGAEPGDGGTITPPDGGMTVAAALSLEAGLYDAGLSPANVSVYGVVTFAQGYYVSKGKAYAGTYYIQDMPADGAKPAQNSALRIYVGSKYVIDGGLSADGPSRGDVIYVTDLQQATYGNNLEYDFQAGSSLSTLGQSALPPAVAVSATDLKSNSSTINGYTGMRVVNKNQYTVTDVCPTLQ